MPLCSQSCQPGCRLLVLFHFHSVKEIVSLLNFLWNRFCIVFSANDSPLAQPPYAFAGIFLPQTLVSCVLQCSLLFLADIVLWSRPFGNNGGESCCWVLFLSWNLPSRLWGRSRQWGRTRKRSLLSKPTCRRTAQSGPPPGSCGKACSRYRGYATVFMLSHAGRYLTYFRGCLISVSSQLKPQQMKSHM